MNFLLILSAVAFVLGVARGDCDYPKKTECITITKESIKKQKVPPELFCQAVNDVRQCVIVDAGCSLEDAHLAAIALDGDLELNCKSEPNWEKNGVCSGAQYKCGQDYNNTIIGETDKSKICNAIGVYEKCTMNICSTLVISKEMKKLMQRAHLDKCENIDFSECEDFAQEESCLGAFGSAQTELDLAGDEKMLCMLAAAVERCLRTKANCIHQTIVKTMKNRLGPVECSEYMDLCKRFEEETCNVKYSTHGNCGQLNDYKLCLTTNASCPTPRLHHIMRNVMKDRNLDCEDTSACEYVKEANCAVDATKSSTTAAEKCQAFSDYKKCMDRANCNAKYMNSRIDKMNDQLGRPCGASSLLASIGLTLLLAAFAGPWK